MRNGKEVEILEGEDELGFRSGEEVEGGGEVEILEGGDELGDFRRGEEVAGEEVVIVEGEGDEPRDLEAAKEEASEGEETERREGAGEERRSFTNGGREEEGDGDRALDLKVELDALGDLATVGDA